jgi:hypothetical protein
LAASLCNDVGVEGLPESITARALEEAVAAAVSGDNHSWTELLALVEPLIAWLASRRAGPRITESGQRDVYIRVVDRLRADKHAALAAYVEARERHPRLDFATYLAAIVTGAVSDYLGTRSDNPRNAAARSLASAIDDFDFNASLAAIGAGQVPSIARRSLLLWIHGNDSAEIAAELAMIAEGDAKRLLEEARDGLRAPPPEAQ